MKVPFFVDVMGAKGELLKFYENAKFKKDEYNSVAIAFQIN